MATITEQDIVEFLKEKIQFHTNEAKRLEGVLSAFTNSAAPLQQDKTDAPIANKVLNGDAEQISEPKSTRKPKQVKIPETSSQTDDLVIPPKYTDDLAMDVKVAFALKEIGEGFNEDIANAMAQYEPKSDAKKISKQIADVLLALKEKGYVKTEKVGRKYRFSLAE